VADEENLTIRIPRGILDQIREIAEREQRSVSGQVRLWLVAAIERERGSQR
jgi:hypothetical protein